MAGVAVHCTLATLPPDYVMITIFIPDQLSMTKVNLSDLAADWNAFPHPVSTQIIGDQIVSENKPCLIQVPSAVTRGDFNILINPNHAEFSGIKITSISSFPFDKKIFK